MIDHTGIGVANVAVSDLKTVRASSNVTSGVPVERGLGKYALSVVIDVVDGGAFTE
jgi:hypothetical protein